MGLAAPTVVQSTGKPGCAGRGQTCCPQHFAKTALTYLTSPESSVFTGVKKGFSKWRAFPSQRVTREEGSRGLRREGWGRRALPVAARRGSSRCTVPLPPAAAAARGAPRLVSQRGQRRGCAACPAARTSDTSLSKSDKRAQIGLAQVRARPSQAPCC